MPAAPIISCCCRESTETLANGATTTFALDVATGVGLARGAGVWRGLRTGAGRGRAERVVWTLFFGRLATAGDVLLATGGVGRPAVARGACLNGGLREIATAGAGVAFSGAVGVVFSGALITVTSSDCSASEGGAAVGAPASSARPSATMPPATAAASLGAVGSRPPAAPLFEVMGLFLAGRASRLGFFGFGFALNFDVAIGLREAGGRAQAVNEFSHQLANADIGLHWRHCYARRAAGGAHRFGAAFLGFGVGFGFGLGALSLRVAFGLGRLAVPGLNLLVLAGFDFGFGFGFAFAFGPLSLAVPEPNLGVGLAGAAFSFVVPEPRLNWVGFLREPKSATGSARTGVVGAPWPTRA